MGKLEGKVALVTGGNSAIGLATARRFVAEADLTNRRTHEADHNSARMEGLLADFRRARDELVRRLEAFSEEGAAVTALHPRLQAAMNVVDFAYFVAEHDDYHLARITELLREAAASTRA